ncbi:MAG: universal stress protein [Anaerolineae bacterium]|nr:universal stress protein [Anaerolineae bacterium]
MSGEGSEPIFQRILVALDASPHSLAALEAAVALAADLQAELLGLFVEDVDLLRLAGLPFARELGLYSATPRPLDEPQVERELRARARRAEQALAAMADRAQVRWSFRVARGTIAAELLAAAVEADLISLGRAGWSPTGRRRVGSTARAVLSQAPRPALVVQQGVHLELPVMAVYDGSALAGKALATAARLAEGRAGELLVLVAADDPDETERLQGQAAGWLQGRGIPARFRQLTEASVSRLVQTLKTEGCGTLILPAELALLRDEALATLVEELDCPMLLIR